MTLRHIAAIATTDNDSSPTREFLDRTTAADMAEALGNLDRCFPTDGHNEAYAAVWALVDSYRQYAYEAGLRAGARLMQEIMAEVEPAAEIERRARAEVATR